MKYLTDHEMWDQTYKSHDELSELSFDWRNYLSRAIAEKIEKIDLQRKKILEIGAGNSQWLPYFAKKYPQSMFAGLDYSKTGCEKLASRIAATGVADRVVIYYQDIFMIDSQIHGEFDVILSFGVVEHFSDLSQILSNINKYLKNDGIMFTLIPNMAGSIGYLTRIFNKKIYDTHNPHDLRSLLDGHRKAGMEILSKGYLGSTGYSVLSSCFNEKSGAPYHIYVFLSRLSKAIWYIESKLGDLPASKVFSPYIYVVSRKTQSA